MRKFLNKISDINIHPRLISVSLLFTTILAYGIFVFQTGFYWDDLPISWIRYQFGVEATRLYFSYSRPIWALLYQATGYLLPRNPVYWQIFALFLRWISAVVLWEVISTLFPKRKSLSYVLSLSILVYPGFNQQWVSYVYAHFFIVLFFFLISLLFMLRGKTIPALIFSALNLLMFEYFFFLEFVRPFLILLFLRDQQLSIRERIYKAFKLWFPYFLTLVFSTSYRLLVFTHPGFEYSLTEEISKSPYETLTHLFGNIASSLWTVVVAAWTQIFQFPSITEDGFRTTLFYSFVVFVVFIMIIIFNRQNDEWNKNDGRWLIFLGVVMLFLGGIPYWVTNLPVTLGFPANRATLSFMFGACFLLLGLFELIPSRKKYIAVIAIVSLAAGRQFLWSNEYRSDWNLQKNLFWQMIWRAPGLEPNTMVMMNEELKYSADNSIGASLNMIYAPNNHDSQVDYVLFYPSNRLDSGSLSGLEPGIPVEYDYLAGQFHGNTSQTVVFYYSPPGCLRLLDPDIDSFNRLIPDETFLRDAAKLSDPSRIGVEPTAHMPEIYNPEPAHRWCYYFEQADLARQTGDWEKVASLGDQAFKLDDYPNDPIERFVFVEGYAHVGEWEKALEYSQVSYKVSKNYFGPLLCRLWQRIDRETQVSSEKDKVVKQSTTLFGCNP